ncbi:MAG: hypothetical protein GY822_26860 [Deltaproteobacteria bacterium]|nr:hypothetical protein [Deltaproteobacteria bacterium]
MSVLALPDRPASSSSAFRTWAPLLFCMGLLFSVSIGTSGCIRPVDVDAGSQTCSTSADCPGTQLCQDNICAEPTGCDLDGDCPDGQRCIENGRCRANVQCIVDDDCCPAGEACTSACDNYQCTGDQCQSGDAQDCFVGCHRGTAQCEAGLWLSCNAAPIEAEICGDGVDNDCENGIDDGCEECSAGQTQVCDLGCGPGNQGCDAAGKWTTCDAPSDCLCEAGQTQSRTCGSCGLTESTCEEGVFVDGECVGEGICAAGSSDSQDCGNCGVQNRDCSDECGFGEWSACVEPLSACTPDEEERRGCGTCGGQTRTCDSTCGWSDWGVCDENAGCSPGEIQTQVCGNCGQRTSTCNASCEWDDFGSCFAEGQCTPQAVESEECGDCGERSRTCSDTCNWTGFSTCSGEGPCSPNDVDIEGCGPEHANGDPNNNGICQQGDRERTCGATCQWEAFGSCVDAVYEATEICGNGVDEDCDTFDNILPDLYEPNNDCASAHSLGTDPALILYPTYDNIQDRDDFFKLYADDNLGDESISVTLTDIPTGMDLDVFLYKGLSNCQAGTLLSTCGADDNLVCQGTNTGNSDESLLWNEQSSGGNDGDEYFYVHVRTYFENQCYLPYTLTVNGLN